MEDVRNYEQCLQSMGGGSFGEIEFDGVDKVLLRTAGIKTTEVSGAVRMYFNARREEVISGRRFEPVSNNLLRPMVVYKILTTLKIKDLPLGIHPKVALTVDASDVFALIADIPSISEDGTVAYFIMPFRKVDLEKMTSPARLMLESEGRSLDYVTSGYAQSEPVNDPAVVITSTADIVPKKKTTKKAATKKAVKNESDVSRKHAGTNPHGRL